MRLAETGGDPSQDGCAFHVNGLAPLLDEFKANGLQKELSEFSTERHRMDIQGLPLAPLSAAWWPRWRWSLSPFRDALVVLAGAVPEPSGVAERRQGPGGPGRGARATAGTVERITVRGKALEGNSQGESPDRAVTVYLPPSYAGDQARRFPTVYMLHGAGGSETTFTEVLARLPQSADRLAGAQGFSEFIVVTPNATQKGSMYSNSPATGDWERFVAEDLVGYVDGHYRTLAHRMSRGLAGHDAGGYAAIRIGMKRPDVFANLFVMSASGDPAALEIDKHASNLNAYYGIAIDIGLADTALESSRQLHAAMTTRRGFLTPTRNTTAITPIACASGSNRACCRSSRETSRRRPI